jgi:two-component system NtrC family sensor kinase
MLFVHFPSCSSCNLFNERFVFQLKNIVILEQMRLKIWHKMIIGIAIPSLIVVLGSLINYGYISDTENRQRYVLIADDLKEHVLEVRRNEKNFFHFKNAEHLDNLQNEISALSTSVNNISLEVVEEIGKEEFSLFNETLKVYSNLLKDLYESYQQEDKVVEEVRAKGRELETFVSQGQLSQEITTSFILHLRLLEKNYMLFRDKKSFNELNSRITQIRNVTPYCHKCNPYIAAINNLFSAYNKSDSLANKIQDTGNAIEDITGRIVVRERAKISVFFTKTKRLLVIALIILCTVGPLLVYKTASYIVAPIKRLAEITEKIAEGDLTQRAPLREHDETYSLATSFNTMLDHLQLTHDSLEHSLHLLHEKQAQLVDSEKRATLGLLVSGVAHELNNPLNNISLTAETMREGLEEFSKEELDDYIKDILSQSERAHNIVENLLDFARARRSTAMEKQDIVRIVKESFNLVANQLRINNISLEQNIPDTALFVKGNRSKLEQILVSIFTNAIQAMKTEGTLTVSVMQKSEDRNILIKISDTGPGISGNDIKNIFEPFFTTKPVGEGTGLGLSVSRSLVMEHKGEIEVESTLGKGTTFIIKLPPFEAAP